MLYNKPCSVICSEWATSLIEKLTWQRSDKWQLIWTDIPSGVSSLHKTTLQSALTIYMHVCCLTLFVSCCLRLSCICLCPLLGVFLKGFISINIWWHLCFLCWRFSGVDLEICSSLPLHSPFLHHFSPNIFFVFFTFYYTLYNWLGFQKLSQH